jgi:hypothetical protein
VGAFTRLDAQELLEIFAIGVLLLCVRVLLKASVCEDASRIVITIYERSSW